MFRRMILSCAALSALMAPALAAPVPAGATDSPLAAVPAQSPIVVHLKGVDRVRERLKTFLTNAVPDFGPMAAGQIDNMVGNLPDGRKMQGMAPAGPVFLAFLALPTNRDEMPDAALIVKVTKYAEFRDGILTEDERKALKSVSPGVESTEINGKPVFLHDRNGYAVVTASKTVSETMAKGYGGLHEKMPRELADKLLDHDLGVYVNLATVNKDFGDQIKELRDMAMQMIDGGGALPKDQADNAKKMYGAVFQAVLDGRALVLATDFRPDAMSLHVQSHVGAETESNKLLVNQKPGLLEQFGKLPLGQMMYTAYEMAPETAKLLAGLSDDEAGKKVAEALSAAKGKSNYASSNYPIAGLTFQEFENPAKALEATLGMIKGMGEGKSFSGGMVKGQPVVTPDAATFKDVKFTEYKIAWDLEKMAEAIPGGAEAMKVVMTKTMGTELHGWMGVDGKRMVTVTAKDWDAAKARLESYYGSQSVGGNAAFQSTRKALPAAASMLAMMDAGPYAYAMADLACTVANAIPGIPINLPKEIKPTKMAPTFIGMAVTLQPERGSFDFYLPVAAIQTIEKVVKQVMQGDGQ